MLTFLDLIWEVVVDQEVDLPRSDLGGSMYQEDDLPIFH